ncbi:hypothetical protein SAMN05660472_00820 [Natronincola ferrireducens]|uniref:Uncharacterized protein n=1 Tax=Natronincola ferrireducens TaxID=393762 RepID=A0A1G8ZEE1_9FIRM|nr:hypothetical protein SAMN05660472_00820 [Natronincola ferrireducens]
MTIDYLFYFFIIILLTGISFSCGWVVYHGLKDGVVYTRGRTAGYKRGGQPISFWFQIIMESVIGVTMLRYLIFKWFPAFPQL